MYVSSTFSGIGVGFYSLACLGSSTCMSCKDKVLLLLLASPGPGPGPGPLALLQSNGTAWWDRRAGVVLALDQHQTLLDRSVRATNGNRGLGVPAIRRGSRSLRHGCINAKWWLYTLTRTRNQEPDDAVFT